MVKFAGKLLVVAALVAAVSGLKLNAIVDYAQVGRTAIARFIQGKIPLRVELARMGRLVDELDERIVDDRRVLAQRIVALEDAEADLKIRVDETEAQFAEMASLRAQLGQCDTVDVSLAAGERVAVSQQLGKELALYKGRLEANRQFDAAVRAQRKAVASLRSRLSQFAENRELLQQQLESLQSRALVAESQTKDVLGTEAQTSLDEVKKLADEIESKLRIEEKVVELSQDAQPGIATSLSGQDPIAAFDALVAGK